MWSSPQMELNIFIIKFSILSFHHMIITPKYCDHHMIITPEYCDHHMIIIPKYCDHHLRWSSRTLGSVCWAEGSSSSLRPSIWVDFAFDVWDLRLCIWNLVFGLLNMVSGIWDCVLVFEILYLAFYILYLEFGADMFGSYMWDWIGLGFG